MAAEGPAPPAARSVPSSGRRNRRYSSAIFRAPSTPASVGLVLAASVVDAFLAAAPGSLVGQVLPAFLVFIVPGILAAVLTPAVASATGGRFSLRRSTLLSFSALLAASPFVILVRLVEVVPGAPSLPLELGLLGSLAFVLWLRHMSLFGVSNPSHPGSLLPSLLQPVIAAGLILGLYGFDARWLFATLVFLLVGFLAAALLLRAADRPLRREFGISGVSLLRPIFDHINLRDPAATATLETFFRKSAIPADLRVTVLGLRASGQTVATVALPTVHPGPFAALGASDLPRKLAERLGPSAGLVLVPHTPCNHDLDLPTSVEVEQIGAALDHVRQGLVFASPDRVSGLTAGRPGSWARAQLLGDTVLLLVTQAPEPTDDIDFAVADRLSREVAAKTGLRVALIDAHNSYVEDRGDVTYGTPAAERLLLDAEAAILAAVAAATPGPVEAGVSVRSDYSIGDHGIGPCGIRALVLRHGGRSTAYVLVDGNNLLLGARAQILDALRGVVDDAEVMTTDNHVVHEVDGSVNAVGEKYPIERLAADVRGVVESALKELRPVEIGSGAQDVPGVMVLGPDATARLLTSLGDTFSMFTNGFVMTFLLLLASSAAIGLAVA